VVSGVKYAIGQAPYMEDYDGYPAYQAYGFAWDMMDEDGKHQANLDGSVTLIWPMPHLTYVDEFDGDWEKDAIIA